MICIEKYVTDVLQILAKMASKEVMSKIKVIVFITVLIFLDFHTKNLALNNLEYGLSNETFFPFVDFLLIYNSGIAFGIFDGKGAYVSYFLLVLTFLISIYLIWLIYNEENFKKKIGLSFVTGGAFGNIFDRLVDGKVTDFLHLEIMNFSFFIFNLADLFITIGAILIIYFEIIYKPKND